MGKPNSKYRFHSVLTQESLLNVHETSDPDKKVLFSDGGNDTIVRTEFREIGRADKNGYTPFTVSFVPYEYEDPTSGAKTEIPEDAVVHCKRKGSSITVDSVQSAEMNTLWKFRFKRGVQQYFDFIQSPELYFAPGDTITQTKLMQVPHGNTVESIEAKYNYILDRVEDGIAYIDIEATSNLAANSNKIESFDMKAAGYMHYHLENQCLVSFQFDSRMTGTEERMDTTGVYSTNTLLVIITEYLGSSEK